MRDGVKALLVILGIAGTIGAVAYFLLMRPAKAEEGKAEEKPTTPTPQPTAPKIYHYTVRVRAPKADEISPKGERKPGLPIPPAPLPIPTLKVRVEIRKADTGAVIGTWIGEVGIDKAVECKFDGEAGWYYVEIEDEHLMGEAKIELPAEDTVKDLIVECKEV
jgi:hypothetical protein